MKHSGRRDHSLPKWGNRMHNPIRRSESPVPHYAREFFIIRGKPNPPATENPWQIAVI
jgi:hypothetical protein